ncbi:hypothetical protein PRIPAC_71956 [Pristionchus pacificus]|uniref:Uncharacterized protein n=1 Tax=Pristionchus pacificus TaxID=54126 RepID=A0A2A6CR13_PRIPA|nr:hypothetical protein PRIPAC_71956 [Pristionchus pacificus]|eukprot:PDM80655.1 hypothetical protein PRIPAC_35658 [Pristionchus pacificus]
MIVSRTTPNYRSNKFPQTPPPLPRFPRPSGLFTFDPSLLNEEVQSGLIDVHVTDRPRPFTREHVGHWDSFYASPGQDVSEFPLETEIAEEEEELLMLRFANGSQMLSLPSLEIDDDYPPEVKKSGRNDENPSVVYDQQQLTHPDIVRHSPPLSLRIRFHPPRPLLQPLQTAVLPLENGGAGRDQTEWRIWEDKPMARIHARLPSAIGVNKMSSFIV